MHRPLVPVAADALRANNFNALRLAMALAVVWSHSFAIFTGSEAREPVSLLMGGVFNAGNLAVLVFFAISGFLITRSYAGSRSAAAYLRKRVARIYPGYLVAVLLCSLVIVPAVSSRAFLDPDLVECRRLLRNLALKNYILPSDAFGGGAVNGSLWSISYEFWCYIGVLALGLWGMLRASMMFPLVSLAAIGVRAWLDLTGRHPAGVLQPVIGTAYWWFVVLPPFTLGASLLAHGRRVPRSRLLLVGLVAATIAASHLPIAPLLRTVLTRTLLPPVLAYATLYLAFSRSLRLPDAARWGDLSYGAYLYAFPIQQSLKALLAGRAGFPVLVLLSLCLSLIAGWLSWHLVERWFVQRRHGSAAPPLTPEATLVAP